MSQLYTFQLSMQAKINISMVGKSTRVQVSTDMRQKTSQLSLLYRTGIGFNSRNNFANLGFFAKVSIPLHFIIPWSILKTLGSCVLRESICIVKYIYS